MEGFLNEQKTLRSETKDYYAYSIWYEDWNYSGDNQLLTYAAPVEIDDLRDHEMDNMISSQKIKTNSGGCILYDDYDFDGDWFYTDAGEEIPMLAWHDFNDKTSSLKVYAP